MEYRDPRARMENGIVLLGQTMGFVRYMQNWQKQDVKIPRSTTKRLISYQIPQLAKHMAANFYF